MNNRLKGPWRKSTDRKRNTFRLLPEEWMALLLFCITSMRAPTMPVVGAGVGGPDSG